MFKPKHEMITTCHIGPYTDELGLTALKEKISPILRYKEEILEIRNLFIEDMFEVLFSSHSKDKEFEYFVNNKRTHIFVVKDEDTKSCKTIFTANGIPFYVFSFSDNEIVMQIIEEKENTCYTVRSNFDADQTVPEKLSVLYTNKPTYERSEIMMISMIWHDMIASYRNIFHSAVIAHAEKLKKERTLN
jgi:hypothetical protein